MDDDVLDPLAREPLLEVWLVAGLCATFLACGFLGGCGRLRGDGAFGRGRLELLLEIAEFAFEFEDAGFELVNHVPAKRALGHRVIGRGGHTVNMTDLPGKRKTVSRR
jgi:hypothetical protein